VLWPSREVCVALSVVSPGIPVCIEVKSPVSVEVCGPIVIVPRSPVTTTLGGGTGKVELLVELLVVLVDSWLVGGGTVVELEAGDAELSEVDVVDEDREVELEDAVELLESDVELDSDVVTSDVSDVLGVAELETLEETSLESVEVEAIIPSFSGIIRQG
jgi:hypothetical protein